MDFFDFAQQAPDTSQGRFQDGEGYWLFYATASPGSANLSPISVPDPDGLTPGPLKLLGNVPNPFNPATSIRFEIHRPAVVTVQVFSVAGRQLREIPLGRLHAGRHAVSWDGKDDAGRAVGSGVYFARVTTNREFRTEKMLLLR
jgi:hypothetical protein